MSDSTFKMTTLNKQIKSEKLTLKTHGIKGRFNLFTGKSGEYWVSIVPALNTSGYGKTEEEQTDKLTKVVDAQIRIQREQDQG